MTADAPRFLPDYLRPQKPGRRSRRGLVLLSVVPFMLLAVPMWRVETVQIDVCPKLPPSAVASLRELVGQPAIGLDVGAIKERVQIWPGVGEVGVEFVLPGTVVVRAETAPTLGSVRVGRSWHGVSADGSLTGRLEQVVEPVLEGFATAAERQLGLEAALRIEKAAGIRVAMVEHIVPGHYRVEQSVADGRRAVVLHVRPRGSAAEQAWCAEYARGNIAQTWADLRWTDRIVIGGGV